MPIPTVISINSAASKILRPYTQTTLTTIDNKYDIKIAKIQGPYVWHRHLEEDELFHVLDGTLLLSFKEDNIHDPDELDSVSGFKIETVTIGQGEMILVPKGMWHCPDSIDGCLIMLVEKRETIQSGGVLS